MRASVLLLAVAWSTACMVSPQDYAGRACDAEHPCLDGRVCVANQCVEPSDSGCPGAPIGETCGMGQGVCATTGIWVCAGGTPACDAPVVDPGTESCDGLDNDCNGVVDDVSGCMTTLVGQSGPAAFRDGTGSEARVAMPGYLNVGADGHLLLADTGNHAIRHITLDGEVTTIAGVGRCGFQDGPVATARFCEPVEVVQAQDGALYVSDAGNHRIRRIHDGQVTTVVGTGVAGHQDGHALTARLEDPQGLHLRPDGSLLIADSGNGMIRRYIPGPTPQVETYAGAGWGTEDGTRESVLFYGIGDVVEDGEGQLFVSERYGSRIRLVPPVGESWTIGGQLWQWGYRDGEGTEVRMSEPTQLVLDEAAEILYFADYWNYEVRALPSVGRSHTIGGAHSFGYASGPFSEARAQGVKGFAMLGGDVFFTDMNHAVRRTTAVAGELTTTEFVASTLDPFTRDGPGDTAQLRQPRSLIRATDGSFYWVDYTAHSLRKLSPEGRVETLIGRTDSPMEGTLTGDFADALLSWPAGLAFTPDGTLYLAELGNSAIRKLDLETQQLRHFAGATDGSWGHEDGAALEARFDGPRGIAYGRDAAGQDVLYVGDTYNRVLRKIVLPDGPVSTIAGIPGVAAREDGPLGVGTFATLGPVAADLQGNVWVVEEGRIRHLSPAGVLSTAYSGLPVHVESVVLDGDSLVASGEAMVVRMNALPPDDGSVEVVFEGRFGWQDGVSLEAAGGDFESIVAAPDAYYVADFLTGQIRQLWR